MPPFDSQQPLLPSLLDRLIDDDPGQASEPLWRGSYRLETLREHVRRDLEFLLNCRHNRRDLISPGGELSVSVLSYGLPDFTGVVGDGIESRERVRESVLRAINNFEPRLQNVSVDFGDADEFERNVRLTIRATLCVQPIFEPVTFDTTVEASTGTCEVRPT